MKKYFMAGTDEEIQFGEMIELDFTKDTKRGITHHHMEIKFVPELVEYLLEEEVIEEKEVEEEGKDKKPIIDVCDDTNFNIEAFIEDFEALEERVDRLEETLKETAKITADTNLEVIKLVKFVHEAVAKIKDSRKEKTDRTTKKK